MAGVSLEDHGSGSLEKAGYRLLIQRSFGEDEASGRGTPPGRQREEEAQSRSAAEFYILLPSAALTHAPGRANVAVCSPGNISISTWMPFMEVLLATPVQFVIGARFYQSGVDNAVRARSGNMDVLVVMGTTAAYSLQLVSDRDSLGVRSGAQASCISRPRQ